MRVLVEHKQGCGRTLTAFQPSLGLPDCHGVVNGDLTSHACMQHRPIAGSVCGAVSKHVASIDPTDSQYSPNTNEFS